jgi:chromosome segregation ATPase
MRPVEFAPEAIIQAGADLHAAGRNITGFALRQKVGGGNPSRLKQVWDEHMSSQAVTRAEPVAELPIEVAEEVATVTKALTERLAALAVELNDKAVKAAERRVHEVVRSAGEQREQAERELADASQTVDDLETKLDEATTAAEGLKKTLGDVQTANQAQAVELAQLRERLAVTEQTAKAASAEHAAELARMNTAIEDERARHRKDADQARAELAEQKKAAQAAAAERDQVRAELATAKATAQAAPQGMTKAEADRDQVRKEASTAREDAAKLRGQVEAMQNQTADLMRALADRQMPGAKPEKAAGAKKPSAD